MHAVVDTQMLRVGSTNIRLLESGSGDPLLFLHGSGDLGTWPAVLDSLAQNFHVVNEGSQVDR